MANALLSLTLLWAIDRFATGTRVTLHTHVLPTSKNVCISIIMQGLLIDGTYNCFTSILKGIAFHFSEINEPYDFLKPVSENHQNAQIH